jgi:hypothetical protein
MQYRGDTNPDSLANAHRRADADTNSATYANYQTLLITASNANRYQQELHRYH